MQVKPLGLYRAVAKFNEFGGCLIHFLCFFFFFLKNYMKPKFSDFYNTIPISCLRSNIF